MYQRSKNERIQFSPQILFVYIRTIKTDSNVQKLISTHCFDYEESILTQKIHNLEYEYSKNYSTKVEILLCHLSMFFYLAFVWYKHFYFSLHGQNFGRRGEWQNALPVVKLEEEWWLFFLWEERVFPNCTKFSRIPEVSKISAKTFWGICSKILE